MAEYEHVIREGDSLRVSATKAPAPSGMLQLMVDAEGGGTPGRRGDDGKAGNSMSCSRAEDSAGSLPIRIQPRGPFMNGTTHG